MRSRLSLLFLSLTNILPLPASALPASFLPFPQPMIDTKEAPQVMNSLYSPYADWSPWFKFGEGEFQVLLDNQEWITVSSGDTSLPPRYWRSVQELPPITDRNRPLTGLHLALDPGHIGGKWAKVEERFFQFPGHSPVAEGDMVLKVAKMVKKELESLGAKVSLVREDNDPTTDIRPDDLRAEAARQLGLDLKAELTKEQKREIKLRAERLFYRTREIEARGKLVNEKIQPDAVIAIHFNGAPWPKDGSMKLSKARNMHLLVFGAVMESELANEDQRAALMHKLLADAHAEELLLAEALKRAMILEMGYPKYEYTGKNAVARDSDGYIWGRNLLANRLYRCPVVYLEPYIMNGEYDYLRIQEGDYEGYRMVGGEYRKSIYREYRDAVVKGVLAHYGKR